MLRRVMSPLFRTMLLVCTWACSGTAADRPDSAAPADTFKVALLTPGPISDRSWNGGAYDGLMRVRDSLGAVVSHVQTRTPAEFEENFREYGTQGYDAVFGHGNEFKDAAMRVGPSFPKTAFIVSSSDAVQPPNVAGMKFAFAEASYLAGYLAGGLSKSGMIGAIGGTELPPVRESFDAFEAGARAANPSVRVIASYIGNWEDVSAGKEQALAQIARGVDVIFQNADAAGLGVFQAAREKPGVLVFGSNADQNAIAPEVTVGSVVIDLPHAFLTVAREVRDGKFSARSISLGTDSEIVKLVINPTFASRIPAAVTARLDSLRGAISSGSLRLDSLASRKP